MPDADPAPAPAADDGWDTALDTFAEVVRGHAAVAAGALPMSAIVEFRWPGELGELPTNLASRAQDLVRESDALAERHQTRLAFLAAQSRLLALHPLAQTRTRHSFSG